MRQYMNILAHILILASYAVVAVLVYLVSPEIFTSMAPGTSMVLGAAVFLVSMQLHGLYIFRMGRQDMASRLMDLHQDYQMSLDRLEEVRLELQKHEEKINRADFSQNAEIISEMRVLQTLLNQVVEKSGKRLTDHVANEELARQISSSSLGTGLADQEGRDRSDEEILRIMHYALEDNRVDLYLQPIVALPSRRVVYFEAYSRVRDERDNVIFPSQYIQLAEDSGLVGTLDNLLLFRCIQVIRRLGPRKPDLRFFCNISSVSLNDQEFFPQFIDFMLENHELADRLVFEFSQQDVMRHSATVARSLASLGRRGFRFSMDKVFDYNIDLGDLASRYFRYVKMDAGALLEQEADIHPDDIKEAFARYDIDLIIEKIEDEQTILEVLDFGMDFGQGYLFGEPRLSSDPSLNL
ncbi:EAL domain-containing protein [Emcibacter nanhaiensis]|uniref:EAL domain-containing protein n=2 Tax=Emcibacter nanhaiensis TaxID=1505037 RepID=A0A501PN12_9PROT|nr:EAL domain-containing protein [Emcibacter nanhaiensis]